MQIDLGVATLSYKENVPLISDRFEPTDESITQFHIELYFFSWGKCFPVGTYIVHYEKKENGERGRWRISRARLSNAAESCN